MFGYFRGLSAALAASAPASATFFCVYEFMCRALSPPTTTTTTTTTAIAAAVADTASAFVTNTHTQRDALLFLNDGVCVNE